MSTDIKIKGGGGGVISVHHFYKNIFSFPSWYSTCIVGFMAESKYSLRNSIDINIIL